MQFVPEKNFDNKIIGKDEDNTLNDKDYENIQGFINNNSKKNRIIQKRPKIR